MNTKRLLTLAKFLEEKVPRKAFDYAVWFGAKVLDSKGRLRSPAECGTTACAMGWACMIPAFKRAGLTVRLALAYGIERITFKGQAGAFDAAEALFDLTEAEAVYLFSPSTDCDGEATPKQVAKKIRKFVRDAQRGAP